MNATDDLKTENLKAKAEQYDLQGKAKTALETAQKLLAEAIRRLGDLTHSNRGKINRFADKGAEWVDTKSNHKYSSQVTKVRGLVDKGVDKVEQQGKHTATTEAHVKENIDDFVKPTGTDQAYDQAEQN